MAEDLRMALLVFYLEELEHLFFVRFVQERIGARA